MKHPWGEDDIRSLVTSSGKFAIVAQADSSPIAYVGASYVLDECEIGNICTHPDFRRQGAAKALLEMLFTKCKSLGITKVFLEVSSVNYGAISLYEKLGFTKYNMRKDYYGKGDDALLFVYEI